MLEHIKAVTAKTYLKRLKQLSAIADLNDPQRIKTLICTYQSTESYKELLANAYDYYVQYSGLRWSGQIVPVKINPFSCLLKLKFDQLISNCRLKMSVFLETLKETGVDSGEAWLMKLTDINLQDSTVAVTPTKNHNARTLHISSHLLIG